ncbi:MAG: T9SS type A sorting domain-containing protein, partial [Bacteroidia bacterium]|nr:T9SS type A sorting domain-containing protein [Bacteroidia bacterium]
LNYAGGPNEYPQVCTPPCSGNDARLRVTGITPNIGFGPLTVEGKLAGIGTYICGTDTFTSSTNPANCPDGSSPRQLIYQRVYHKNGNSMTYYDRPGGSMSYHTGHNHYHVDDWCVFTLRYQIIGEPDPRNWPIAAQGAKLGFCLMDYYSCPSGSAANHCKDNNTVYNQGNNLNTSAQFPNYGLGGGSYACSISEQGISSGWEDVYYESLDLMWINLPPNLCNGQYWIVMEVDPRNNFLESDETNNYTAVPFAITQQNPPLTNPVATIATNRQSSKICPGETITLTASSGSSFQWSTGATTQSITVNAAGTYNVTVSNYCGVATSAPMEVVLEPTPTDPVTTNDLVCEPGGSGTLTATTTGNVITWTDSQNNIVGTGNSFITPVVSSTTTYFATATSSYIDTTKVGPMDGSFGVGANLNSANYNIFTVYSPTKLISVKVIASGAGNRTIELRDSTGALLQTITVNVPAGTSRVTLNWNISPGVAYTLGAVGGTINMFRNNTNAILYPYTIPGALSITGSSAGPTYYYYFYDWEVETQNQSCVSNSMPAIITVDPCLSVGSDPSLNRAISVFPNPASDKFEVTFNFRSSTNTLIEVYDVVGKVVYSNTLGNITGVSKQTINTSSFGKGIYTLRINADGKNFVRKLIIN